MEHQLYTVNEAARERNKNIDGEKLSDLTFAEDVALTTEDVKEMEH